MRTKGYRALPERAVLLTVEALDWNCPQHIPQRYTLAELELQLGTMRSRIFELEKKNADLRKVLADSTP